MFHYCTSVVVFLKFPRLINLMVHFEGRRVEWDRVGGMLKANEVVVVVVFVGMYIVYGMM